MEAALSALDDARSLDARRVRRDLAEMAFVHAVELPTARDTGTLEGDLVALGERIAELTARDSARAALAGLVAELAGDPDLSSALEERLFIAERRYVAVVLERACARGELGRGTDPELVRRLLIGPIVFMPLFAPTAQPRPRDLARLVVAGLLLTHPPEVDQ